MDSKQAIELEKWEINGFTAEKAVNWLVSASFVSGHTAMFGLANFIQQQEKTITDLQARLREMDEKNRTQAHCLAARCEIIERQSAKCETCFDNYAKVIGKLTERAESAEANVERQERMIGLACEWLQKIGCPVLDDHYCDENCSTKMNGSGCWRRWLEQEAQHG